MAQDDRNPFAAILDRDPFCQGDILHRESDGSIGDFAMIITADCDIAQGKDGGEFSLLRMTTAENYIEQIWARNEIRKTSARHLRTALDILNAELQHVNPSLNPLTAESLAEWLHEQSPAEIAKAVGLAGSKQQDAVRALQCLRYAADESTSALLTLKRLWKTMEMKDKAIQARLSDVLHPARGAADVYFVPYLPEFSDIGFVIHLRSLTTVPRGEAFTSRTDARVAGKGRTFYRIGRFRDGVKYSIVHQMVNLFSRVGLSEEYEAESSSAAAMVLETVYSHIERITP